MKYSNWFVHPIIVFIFSILALGLSLFLYIYWYIEVSTGLQSVVRRFNLDSDQVLASQTWMVILVLSILVAIILVGIFTIFVYNQKILQLYRLQNNFINNFTHELKTPVTSIKLYIETFLKYELSREDQQKYLKYMFQDSERLSDTINRILNLSKIESKRYAGEFKLVDLHEFILDYIEKNKHIYHKCNIRVVELSPPPFYYHISPTLFEMLLSNILTNAMKYNHSEYPTVLIQFEVQKNTLIIQFKDNGIGIEKKELKKIFRKFYQVGSSEDMTAKGSGLGLYLVQNIARLHHGTVSAASAGIGKGSVFTLKLPYRK